MMFPLLLLAALAALPASLVSSEYIDLGKRQLEGPVLGLERLKREYFAYRRRTLGPDCHEDNVIVRKEWWVRGTNCIFLLGRVGS